MYLIIAVTIMDYLVIRNMIIPSWNNSIIWLNVIIVLVFSTPIFLGIYGLFKKDE